MNDSILVTIDRAVAAINVDPASVDLTKARIRLAMIEIAQVALNAASASATDAQTKLRLVEQVLENFVGCSADKLVVRHIDLLRQQPVDLDKLMIAVGGVWAAKARAIIAEEKDRKVQSKAFVDRHASAAPILGFRDQSGKKISEQEAKERVRSAGGSAE